MGKQKVPRGTQIKNFGNPWSKHFEVKKLYLFQVRYTAGPKKGFVIENLEEVQRRTGQLSGYSNAPPLPNNLSQVKPNVVVRVAPKTEGPMRPQQQGKFILYFC